jgi:hypothetical protein
MGGGGRILTEEEEGVCAAVVLLIAGPVAVVAELERGADEGSVASVRSSCRRRLRLMLVVVMAPLFMKQRCCGCTRR